jgi:hypothetical protein
MIEGDQRPHVGQVVGGRHDVDALLEEGGCGSGVRCRHGEDHRVDTHEGLGRRDDVDPHHSRHPVGPRAVDVGHQHLRHRRARRDLPGGAGAHRAEAEHSDTHQG